MEPTMMSLVASTWKRLARTRIVLGAPAAPDIPPAVPRTSISGHFYPYFEAARMRVLRKSDWASENDSVDGLPIPPRALHAGYGFDATTYLECGREHVRAMMTIMSESGFELRAGARVLDFGCAAGRMIRCFASSAEQSEFWGVDVRADHILWCQRHLSPPFRFATTTTLPHLPFEDNSFDFIYACSVFTHIGDLEDAWLLELRRVLRPAGRIFATVSDNHTIQLVASSPPGHWLHETAFRRQILEVDSTHGILKSEFSMVAINFDEPGNAQVIHDRAYLRQRWGQYFNILAIQPEGHTYQTAVVMAKEP
jgi:SAM-dependent methyltransferase